MIINEYILYIVLIKRGKIQLVGENKKKWYGDHLHLIHDAPPLVYDHYSYARVSVHDKPSKRTDHFNLL